MPFRCRDSKKYYSVKTGTTRGFTNLPVRNWVQAIYLESTSLKSVSSVKLHRDIGVNQSGTWHMLHRIRGGVLPEMINAVEVLVVVDEGNMGGREANRHEYSELSAGRGTVGKSAVLGVKNRISNQISVKVIEDIAKPTVQEFVNDNHSEDAEVFTDVHLSYKGLANHTTVNHSQKQWTVSTKLDEYARTNGIKSFWAIWKRACQGTNHHLSKKHLNRYVTLFADKHNLRSLDTIDQMAVVERGMAGKQLRYKDPISNT